MAVYTISAHGTAVDGWLGTRRTRRVDPVSLDPFEKVRSEDVVDPTRQGHDDF